MVWCSECGGEHREGASACVFCGGTLVDVAPTPPVETPHEPVAVDISALDESQRSVLRLLIGSNDLHAEIVDDRVLLAVEDAVEVEALVQDLLAAEELDVDEPVEWSGTSAEDDAPPPLSIADGRPIAGTGTRAAAWLVNALAMGVLTGIASYVAQRLGAPAVLDGSGEVVAFWVVEVALVGHFGWDPGKLMLGIRVVGADGTPPGWRRAALRSVVMIGPFYSLPLLAWSLSGLDGASGVLVGAANVLALAWLPWLLWTVANGPMHQGWHDRAARTYVVER